ncbi:hypothetical protein CHKEEEPN_4957 [Methylorubrum podarium]|nr:hypothetical protein CHKEEEPN_4957 [Methylorubrum podarium]
MLAGAGALHQAGQAREDGGREAAPGRRLARGQPDLAERAGEAGDRIHHQHDAPAGVAKMLGDGRRGLGRLHPLDRRAIGGRDDEDGAGHALGPEMALDEFAHLAPALADQGDDADIGLRALHDLREQRGLAAAGLAVDAEPLALADGEQPVDDADPERHRPLDQLSRERVRGGAAQGPRRRVREVGAPVEGPAAAVEDAPEQAVPHRHLDHAPGRHDLDPARQALDAADRRQQGRLGREAHHLRLEREAAAAVLEAAQLADPHARHHGVDHRADGAGNVAAQGPRLDRARRLAQARQGLGQRRHRALGIRQRRAHDALFPDAAERPARSARSCASSPSSTLPMALRRQHSPG